MVVFSAGLVLALGRLGELDPTTDLVVLPVVGQSTIEIEQTHCHRGGTFHEEIAQQIILIISKWHINPRSEPHKVPQKTQRSRER